MLNRLGTVVVRYRLLVILIWVVLLIPAFYAATHLHKVLQSEVASAAGTEMNRQETLLNRDFPQQNLYGIQLVLEHGQKTIDDPQYQQLLQKYLGIISQEKEAATPQTYRENPDQLSKDQRSTFVSIGLMARNISASDEVAERLSTALKKVIVPPGFKMYLTGGPLFGREITTVSAKDGFNTEERVLPLVLLVLVFAFGGLLAASLPMVVGMSSVIMSLGMMYILAHFMQITSLSQNIVSMLGLGVGIDYSLLFVNRFREELFERGLSKEEAAISTLESSGRTILYSGTVVSIGLIALLVPNVVFMRSLGLSGLLVVGITMLLGLTLLPALLSLIGDKINFPAVFSNWTYRTWGKGQFWYRWAKYIMSRPLFFGFVSIGVLLCASLITTELKVWNPTIGIMPKSLETRQGFEKIIEISPRNYFSPIVISFKTKDGSPIWSQQNIRTAHDFMQAIAHQEPILGSIGLINIHQSLDDQMVLYNTIAASGGVAGMQLFQPNATFPFISEDETKGVLVTYHKYEGYIEGESDQDLNTIAEIREYRDRVSTRYPNLEILVGSLSAVPMEMKEAIFTHFPMIVIVTVITTYLLTMFSFGSLLLPLKAVLLNLLSVTATYGTLILVFQKGIGAHLLGIEKVPGALLIVSPLILFCIIFGLSMDYEIFLINRIREEYDACGDPEEAIAQGMEKTGGIITNAGIIMILVFTGFAFSRIIVIKEFGLGLAVAILIDASIIRLMVVPALLKLFGHASWYFPKWLDIPILRKVLKE
ncbi:MAG: MMPL family transporter [Candidatus Sericytochromatia bacterium]